MLDPRQAAGHQSLLHLQAEFLGVVLDEDTEGIVLGIVLVEAGVLDNVCLFLPLFNDLEAHLDSVDDDGGEVLLNQKLGQSHAALHRLHEDD